MRPTKKGRRSQARAPIRPRPVLGLAFGLLLLVGMEGAARFAGFQVAYQPDMLGGWHMLPEAKDQLVEGTHEPHRFTMSTNKDGLRTHLSRSKSAGRRRVALLGDSTTFGWGVSDGETVADGLAEGLRKAGVTEVEVLNAGQPGYTTTQISRFFVSVVAEYKPDLTIVFLPMHDHNLVLVSDREHLDGASGPISAARVFLATRSSLYEVIRKSIFTMSDKAFLVPGRESTMEPRVPRVSDRERAENLEGMRAALAQWGGSLAVGHLPFISDLTSDHPEDRPGLDWATEWSRETHTAVVDLRPCCGPDGEKLVFSFDPGHLTADGNLKAGRYGAAQVGALLEDRVQGTAAPARDPDSVRDPDPARDPTLSPSSGSR